MDHKKVKRVKVHTERERGTASASRPSRKTQSTSKRHSLSNPGAAVPPRRSLDRSTAYQSDSDEPQSESDRVTATGRKSKAKKGIPCHVCDICGKIYTRNEHLKRHKQNHDIAPFKCTIRGCSRQFHREDLRARHYEEHCEYASPTHDHNDSPQNQGVSMMPNSSESTSLKQDYAMTEQEFGSVTFPESIYEPYVPSYFPSTNNIYPQFVEAESSFAQTQPFTPALNSALDSFYIDASHSRSPASTSSSAFQPWSQSKRRNRSLISPADSTSSEYGPFQTFSQDSLGYPTPNAEYYLHQDSFEGQAIMQELSGLTNIPQSAVGRIDLALFEESYLEVFWHTFHPVFPIMHKPTVNNNGTSPLVKALMVAIGAYHIDTEAARDVLRSTREICRKLMTKRRILPYASLRLWDLQAVFLMEVLTVYSSRRPSPNLSHGFNKLTAGLYSDPVNSSIHQPLAVVLSLALIDHTHECELHDEWKYLESKRRLLLACYILEVQLATFFASKRATSGDNLPMPCSVMLWDAESSSEWYDLARRDSGGHTSLSEVLAARFIQHTPSRDPFFTNIASAYYSHSATFTPSFDLIDFSQTIDQSPVSLFLYHAAMFVACTPVYELLAVSGETFVLGGKLPTREQHLQAIKGLKAWVTSDAASQALVHAIWLLMHSLREGRHGLVHEHWALYLAALVFWACKVWPVQDRRGLEGPTRPVDAASNKSAMDALFASAWTPGMSLDCSSKRACLLWVREQCLNRPGGLIEDAVEVLGKLADGRIISNDEE